MNKPNTDKLNQLIDAIPLPCCDGRNAIRNLISEIVGEDRNAIRNLISEIVGEDLNPKPVVFHRLGDRFRFIASGDEYILADGGGFTVCAIRLKDGARKRSPVPTQSKWKITDNDLMCIFKISTLSLIEKIS